MLVVIGLWLLLAVLVGVAADTRGRSGVLWGLLAVAISPVLGGLLVAIFPDLHKRAMHETRWHTAGPGITVRTDRARLANSLVRLFWGIAVSIAVAAIVIFVRGLR